jgi:hypothetical protein
VFFNKEDIDSYNIDQEKTTIRKIKVSAGGGSGDQTKNTPFETHK